MRLHPVCCVSLPGLCEQPCDELRIFRSMRNVYASLPLELVWQNALHGCNRQPRGRRLESDKRIPLGVGGKQEEPPLPHALRHPSRGEFAQKRYPGKFGFTASRHLDLRLRHALQYSLKLGDSFRLLEPTDEADRQIAARSFWWVEEHRVH